MSIFKKITRVLKWVGIILAGLLAILLIINAVMIWITDSQVESRLAAIREAGDPVSLADFRMEEVPVEENAVTYFNRAKSGAKAMEKELMPIYESMRKRAADSEENIEVFPTDAELERIEAVFAAYPQVVPLLRQAANCPGYFVDYPKKLDKCRVDQETGFDRSTNDTCKRRVSHPVAKGTVLDIVAEDTQDLRMFARLFTDCHFPLLMSKKQYDAAVQDGIVVLKLARVASKEPVMVNFLIRSALRYMAIGRINRVLQSQQVSEEVRQELEEELTKVDVRHDYLYSLKTERACNNSCFDEFHGNMPWYSRVFLNWQRIGVLDVDDWAIARATAALPENGSAASAKILEKEPPSCGILGQLLLPAVEATEDAANRSEAQVRMLRVLNALGRRDDPEKEPLPDLSDLGLPNSVAMDPFNGKPLIVKKVNDGWLVYSVGKNRIDDGGDLDEEKRLDIGLQPVPQVQAKAALTEEK